MSVARARSGAKPPDDERFRLLVESVSDYAICMLDEVGCITSWNTGAARLHGYSADEAIGQHWSVFYPEELVAAGVPQRLLDQAFSAGRVEKEDWWLRRDGGRFWASVVVTALRDPSRTLVGYAAITRDLTERRRQEEVVRQSEERFRLLVDGMQDHAIFMLDPSGHVATWNRAAEMIKGYATHEIIGKHFSVFYPAEAIARKWPENELQIARDHGRFEEEGWRVRKDGTTFWANVVITALNDAEGRPRGFAKITRDLSARKRYEELQRSERQMNGFLAMLAHELRNPLDPMRHALDLVAIQPDDARTREWAHDVLGRQVTQLKNLVDDLLDVSRITLGKIALKPEPVALHDVVAKVAESVRPLAAAREQQFEVVIPAAAVACEADPTRLEQMIVNLLTNAVKYTPPGGRIVTAVSREGRFAEVRVLDDGIGISADLIDHVFEPFVQGERALDRADGGLGLGLTLVRRLAEMQGGSVSVTSAGEGRGSTFIIRLPALDNASFPQVKAIASPRERITVARRVLIVDDNHDAAATLGALVAAWGHEVWIAHDGPSALASATEHGPDTILLDIGLPGMNGYEVATALRRLPGLQSSILVACTGYGQERDREAASEAGFAHHLVKPVEVVQLQAILGERTSDRSPRARAIAHVDLTKKSA